MTEPTDTSSLPNFRGQTLLSVLTILAAVLLIFGSTLRFQFLAFDDNTNVYNNPYLNPVTAKTLPRFWGESYYELYTPVTYTLWTLSASLPGTRLSAPETVPPGGETTLKAAPFHALGILFHAANALLVFAILLRLPLLQGRSPYYATVGACLWAIHPLMAEPVAWVTGNNNVFSGFFLLLALLLFLRRLDPPHERTALLWYVLATLSYGLALLAKPTAVALPLMAFVLAVGIYRVPIRSLLLPLGIWIVFAGALLFVTRNTATPVTDVSLPLWQRPLVMGDGLAFYAEKVLLPIQLSVDYGRRPEWLRAQWWFYLRWLIPVGIGAGLFLWYRRSGSETARYLLTGFAVGIMGVLPLLGLAPYYFQRYSTVADRYLYVALLGIALVSAVLASRLPRRLSPLAAVPLLILGFLSYQQSQVWQNSQSLFTHIIQVHPKSMMGHLNLALMRQSEGDLTGALREADIAEACPPQGHAMPAAVATTKGQLFLSMDRVQEALAQYKRAVELVHDSSLYYQNLALVLHRVGQEQAAEAALEMAVTAEGPRSRYAYTVGTAMLKNKAPELGMPYLIEAASGNEQNVADANYILGIMAGNANKNDDAEKYLRAAVAKNPDSGVIAYSLAKILERLGKSEEANSYFAQAQRLNYHPSVNK